MSNHELLKGFEEYLKNSNDPNLKKNSMFYLFDSFVMWDNEGTWNIPKNEIISEELWLNRFFAHP